MRGDYLMAEDGKGRGEMGFSPMRNNNNSVSDASNMFSQRHSQAT